MKKDLIGKIFGRLEVLQECGRTKANKVRWKCKCTCGNEVDVIGASLLTGATKSCGCLNKEKKEERNKGNSFGKKHGMSNSKIYNVWKQMVQRCHLSSHSEYFNYGARGIQVCDEWRNNFSCFYEWAVSHGYGEKLTIERVNNDAGYSPSNCIWTTQREQNLNRRNTVLLDGVPFEKILDKYSLCKEDRNVIRSRVFQLGWTLEKAISTPIVHRR